MTKKHKGQNKVARKLLRATWSRKAHKRFKKDYDSSKSDSYGVTGFDIDTR